MIQNGVCMATAQDDQSKAAAAVLVQSDDMPKDSIKVVGADFDTIKAKINTDGSKCPISVDDLLSSYYTTGFQGSSIGKAVQIINNMVLHR